MRYAGPTPPDSSHAMPPSPPTAKMRVGPGGCRGMMPSVDKTAITADLASRLVAEQFPQWAGLPVRRVEPGGWDNVTFRLGADLSVRLPSGPGYAQQVDKEHRRSEERRVGQE